MLSFDFIAGAATAGYLVAGLFFLRFWRRTGDRLFLAFAVAFWLLGGSQALLTATRTIIEDRSWIYLIRLSAFLLILAAIVGKNRRTR
ncbi:MAG TPA: DUF5985 family protein [Sphingomonas sp.]|jgi:peptidoglycan/LPS O-acetylase OafA/YrhL